MVKIFDIENNELNVGDEVYVVDSMHGTASRPNLVKETITDISGVNQRKINFTDSSRTVIAYRENNDLTKFKTYKCVKIHK